MASPPSVTCMTLSGKFVLNKVISDDLEAMLTLQGISWFMRKAIKLATVVLTITEYKEGEVMHIDITQVASGISTTQEDRVLNWTESQHDDKIFGKVVGKSQLVQGTAALQIEGPHIDDDLRFLRGECLKDMKTPTKFLDDGSGAPGGVIVQSFVTSQGGGWTAEQTWSFEDIDGVRYYTRRVVARKGDQVQRVRLVYNYQGALPDENSKSNDDDGLAYGDAN